MDTPFRASSRTIIETVLVLLLLLALMLALYDVLRVFFGVFTFALIFSVSFSGLFERLVRLVKKKRKLAAVLYSIILIAVIALPFIYIISAMSHHVKEVAHWVDEVKTNGLPPLPDWLAGIPYAGDEIAAFWKQLQNNPKEMVGLHEGKIRLVLQQVLAGGAGMLGAAFEFIAGIIVSAIFLAGGENILNPVYAAISHLLGKKDGPALINATARAVKGVAVGVMGTSFIAAVVSWIGFTIAGIPFALGLAALIFFFVLIQVGPLVVWIPLVIWLAMQGHTGWAVFIAAYGLLVIGVDSVLKPILISKSGKLPFLVLFLGVMGGLIAWGFTGMFKGAIILAVFYTVFNSWLEKAKYSNREETTAE